MIPPTGPEDPNDVSLPEYVTYSGRASGDLFPTIPFTSSTVDDPKQPPYRRHGKLFFTNGGGTHQCSGTIVTAANRSVVATAGHCVFDDRADLANSSTTFAPAFKDGEMPFGLWDATHVLTTPQWIEGDLRYDIGMIVVERHGDSTIQEVLGSRGISFRQEPTQLFESYGYPSDHPFDGEELVRCSSAPGYEDPLFQHPAPNAIGCDMSRGASGGGWLIQTRQGDLVNSVNSYLYPGFDGIMFGPYFGNIAEALYHAAADTPRVVPVDTPAGDGRIEHQLTLTLRLVGHLRAKGSLTPQDGYLACGRRASVGLYKLVGPTTGRLVGGRHNTGPSTRWGYWPKDRPGRYFAYAVARDLDKKHHCAAAQSEVARHRH